jgi:undecaprenyl pyrophosphate phosphatase UppP
MSHHLTYAEAVVTGLIQGVTELFPVSSLGHNVLLPALIGGQWAQALNVSAPNSPYLAFVVGLHVATAVAMIAYFWRDWLRIVRGFFSSVRQREIATADQRLAWMIILATIPVGIVGATLQKVFTHVFAKPELTALFLAANGLILLYSERQRRARAAAAGGSGSRSRAAVPVGASAGGPARGPVGGPPRGGYSQQPRQQQWQGPDPRYGQDDWPHAQDPWGGQGPQYGQGPEYGQDGEFGQDPRHGQDPRSGQAPQYRRDPRPGQDPRHGQDPRYGQDRGFPGERGFGRDDRSGRDSQYGQESRAGLGEWDQDPRGGRGAHRAPDPRAAQDPRYGQAPWADQDPWSSRADQQARAPRSARDPRGGQDPWGPQAPQQARQPRAAQDPAGRHGRRGAGQGPDEGDHAVAADRRLSGMGYGRAVLVGSAQILALLPGISRDGIVTVTGMWRGLSREDAVRFSFLLSAPVILAAGALKAHDLVGPMGKGMHGPVIVGSLLSGIGAYLSIRFLTKYFSEDKSLNPFGIYCLVAGIGSFLYLLIK